MSGDDAPAVPIPLLVKVWAGRERHELRTIRRSLPSLLASGLPRIVHIILVDDCSTDRRLAPLLAECAARYPHVEVWTNPRRLGPNSGQEYTFPRVVERFPSAPFYLLCDDDVIYRPGWLQRLVRVREEANSRGIDGVFTALNVPLRASRESVRLPTSEVLLKERQAALNWLVPRQVYEAVGPFRDVGIAYDSDYCNRMAALGIPVVCLRPSYVQNIGYQGAYQTDDSYTAADYVGTLDAWLRARSLWYRLRRRVRTRAAMAWKATSTR